MVVAQTAIHPSNPFVDADSWYVAAQGVARYDGALLSRRWRVLAGERAYAPVVQDKVVYVATTNAVYALDAAKGKTLWRRPLVCTGSPVLWGRSLIVTTAKGELLALATGSGESLWQQQLAAMVQPPVVVSDHIVVADDKGLHGMRAANGEAVWHLAIEGKPNGRPTVLSDQALVLTLDGGRVLKLRAKDGYVIWHLQDSIPSIPPAFANGMLVFAAADGRVRVRAAVDGSLKWTGIARGKIGLVPHANDELALVWSQRSQLVAFNLANGEVLLRHTERVQAATSPVWFRGKIVLFLTDGSYISWLLAR